MALAIEPTFLDYVMGWLAGELGNRYCVFRACGHATVINDTLLAKRVRYASKDDLARREALEWQADQDEDLDEAEVIHHLHQQAKSSPVFENAISRTERSDAITTLVTSCSVQSPSRLARAQGRPLSSFRRVSFRQSMVTNLIGNASYGDVSNLDKINPYATGWLPLAPKIFGNGLPIHDERVVWHMQLDFVDLLSPRELLTWRPGKRRRTAIDQFHRVPAPPEQDAAPRNQPLEAKQFKGVRYRPERRTWAAEMKPPKSKNKVSFGEFKSQAQAARAIDAAFHYYGKPHLLNFPDTPGILSTRPSPAGVLNEEDQLRFVKEQVKWLASMASTLPSSPPLVHSEIPESPSRCGIGATFEFRKFSEVRSFLSLSCGDADESDDGTSQPLPSLPPDAVAESAGGASMENPLVGADAAGGTMGSSDEHQGMLEWSLEAALVDPSLSGWWSPGSSLQVTHGWDGADISGTPALTHFTNSAEPSCESPGSWRNYLAMSSSSSSFHASAASSEST